MELTIERKSELMNQALKMAKKQLKRRYITTNVAMLMLSIYNDLKKEEESK